MSKGRGVSGKTHMQKQLDDYANQHNPNNKAYWARMNNEANMHNPNNRAYKAAHDNRTNQKNPNNKACKARNNKCKKHYQNILWQPDFMLGWCDD